MYEKYGFYNFMPIGTYSLIGYGIYNKINKYFLLHYNLKKNL